MQGCNDCIFDYHGNLWVTAPAGEIAPHAYERSSTKVSAFHYFYDQLGQIINISL